MCLTHLAAWDAANVRRVQARPRGGQAQGSAGEERPTGRACERVNLSCNCTTTKRAPSERRAEWCYTGSWRRCYWTVACAIGEGGSFLLALWALLYRVLETLGRSAQWSVWSQQSTVCDVHERAIAGPMRRAASPHAAVRASGGMPEGELESLHLQRGGRWQSTAT